MSIIDVITVILLYYPIHCLIRVVMYYTLIIKALLGVLYITFYYPIKDIYMMFKDYIMNYSFGIYTLFLCNIIGYMSSLHVTANSSLHIHLPYIHTRNSHDYSRFTRVLLELLEYSHNSARFYLNPTVCFFSTPSP